MFQQNFITQTTLWSKLMEHFNEMFDCFDKQQSVEYSVQWSLKPIFWLN